MPCAITLTTAWQWSESSRLAFVHEASNNVCIIGAPNNSAEPCRASSRYPKQSTVLTTNIDFEQLGHYLGDPVVTTAIVDRMVHHSTVISIQGPSWRLKESMELNRRDNRTDAAADAISSNNESAGDKTPDKRSSSK